MRMKPRILSWLCGALLLTSLSAISCAPAHAAAGPGRCTGKFVNPITDICWSCLFPISIGGLKIWPSSRPDTEQPALPVCLCGLRPGIAMGFWEPVRLADVSMKPWCFVNLGGMKLDPGFDIGFKSMAGPSAVGGNTQYNSQWHVHWYAYPLIYWMEIVADFLCLESGSIDILYITEIDPLWQDSELTAIINPEAVLFANPWRLQPARPTVWRQRPSCRLTSCSGARAARARCIRSTAMSRRPSAMSRPRGSRSPASPTSSTASSSPGGRWAARGFAAST
jgi:conjugal transfer pilus assembly protein TraU